MARIFRLDGNQSPTHLNLARLLTEQGWQAGNISDTAFVDDSWLHFSSLISETLEYKHLLAAFLQSTELDYLMPETFFIDDEIWPSVLSKIDALSSCLPWILKPSMLNNGQHIHIFPGLDAVEAHFTSSKRMGGPQVLQRYIDRPQLIKGPSEGHKFSIRQLVVLSTHAGSGLYPHGYLNIALNQNYNYFLLLLLFVFIGFLLIFLVVFLVTFLPRVLLLPLFKTELINSISALSFSLFNVFFHSNKVLIL